MAEEKKKMRRQGADSVVRAINVLVIISWVVFLVAFIMVSISGSGGGRSYGAVRPRGSSLYGWAIALMAVQFILCVTGLVVQSSRMKRKSDRYSRSLIIFTALSVAGIIFFIFTSSR